MSPLVFKSLNEDTLLIEWPDKIQSRILDEIRMLQRAIDQHITGIIECYPAYRSLSVTYNPQILTGHKLKGLIESLPLSPLPIKSSHWKLPVSYSERTGADLIEFSKSVNMDVEKVISLHSKTKYRVHFFGFLPGFMYLGGLDSRLHHPRKASPKTKIVPGSVAIGGSQTGVYPSASPGGWHVVGNCPVPLFQPDKNPPCYILPGDEVSFYPIERKEHDRIRQSVQADNFQIKSLIDG